MMPVGALNSARAEQFLLRQGGCATAAAQHSCRGEIGWQLLLRQDGRCAQCNWQECCATGAAQHSCRGKIGWQLLLQQDGRCAQCNWQECCATAAAQHSCRGKI